MAITDQRDLIGDASTDSAAWVDDGGGTTPTTFTDSAPPGVTTVISDKVSNAVDGILYFDSTPTGGSYADSDTIFIWWISLFGAVDTVAGGGVRMKFAGSALTDYFAVTIGGSDSGKTGWQLTAVNIGKARANPDFTGGTPPTAANIQHVGIIWDVTANVGGNNDNVAVGNIYRQTSSERTYRIDAGTDGTPNTWQDVADQVLTDGTGIVQADSNGVFRVYGSFAFGPSSGNTSTTFEDTGVVLAFENQDWLEDDFYQLQMDLPASYTGDARITAGTKTGTGSAAVGVNGWTILTGGTPWRLLMEDPDQTDVQFYGCSFTGAGDSSLDDPAVEMVSNVWNNCGTIEVTGNSVAASMPRWIRNFFSACPGPRAQIVWQNETSPSSDAFQFNTFANMNWFGVEIGQGMTGNLTFEMRDNAFSNNGTNRDILASNDVGNLTINSDASPAPTATNGTTINITMTGTVDRFIYTVNTYQDVSNTDGSDTTGSAAAPLVTETTASLSADDDTFAISAAAPYGALTYTGASDQYTDDILYESVSGGLVARIGLDEVTPGSGTRTGFPVHDGTETEGVQFILNVNENATSTAVTMIDPGHRPWAVVEAGSTATFGYGAPISGTHANPKTFVTVIALDDTSAANTAVSSINIDTGTGTQALTSRKVLQDDNTGASGNSLELSVYDLHSAVDTTEQGGTLSIQAGSVTTLVNIKDPDGNNEEGVRVWLQAADGTDELPYNQAITSITQTAGSPWTRTVTFAAAHGLKTNDYLSLSGITNATQDNSGAFQVTVTSTTVCTYTGADTGETTFTGTITGTGGVLYGTTDASGNISSSRVWSGDQLVTGQARKSSAAGLRFKTVELDDVILAASGLTINRRLVADE